MSSDGVRTTASNNQYFGVCVDIQEHPYVQIDLLDHYILVIISTAIHRKEN